MKTVFETISIVGTITRVRMPIIPYIQKHKRQCMCRTDTRETKWNIKERMTLSIKARWRLKRVVCGVVSLIYSQANQIPDLNVYNVLHSGSERNRLFTRKPDLFMNQFKITKTCTSIKLSSSSERTLIQWQDIMGQEGWRSMYRRLGTNQSKRIGCRGNKITDLTMSSLSFSAVYFHLLGKDLPLSWSVLLVVILDKTLLVLASGAESSFRLWWLF